MIECGAEQGAELAVHVLLDASFRDVSFRLVLALFSLSSVFDLTQTPLRLVLRSTHSHSRVVDFFVVALGIQEKEMASFGPHQVRSGELAMCSSHKPQVSSRMCQVALQYDPVLG